MRTARTIAGIVIVGAGAALAASCAKTATSERSSVTNEETSVESGAGAEQPAQVPGLDAGIPIIPPIETDAGGIGLPDAGTPPIVFDAGFVPQPMPM